MKFFPKMTKRVILSINLGGNNNPMPNKLLSRFIEKEITLLEFKYNAIDC